MNEDIMNEPTDEYITCALGLTNCVANVESAAMEVGDLHSRILLAQALDVEGATSMRILDLIKLKEACQRVYEVWSYLIRQPDAYFYLSSKVQADEGENTRIADLCMSMEHKKRAEGADILEGLIADWKKESGAAPKES